MIQSPTPPQKTIQAQLKDAKVAMRYAWITGLVSGLVTLVSIFSTFRVPESSQQAIFHIQVFINIALILGLSFGVYKKSRVCAVLMVVFFVIGRIRAFLTYTPLTFASITVFLFFLILYSSGVRGTFAYHNLKKRERELTQ